MDKNELIERIAKKAEVAPGDLIACLELDDVSLRYYSTCLDEPFKHTGKLAGIFALAAIGLGYAASKEHATAPFLSYAAASAVAAISSIFTLGSLVKDTPPPETVIQDIRAKIANAKQATPL